MKKFKDFLIDIEKQKKDVQKPKKIDVPYVHKMTNFAFEDQIIEDKRPSRITVKDAHRLLVSNGYSLVRITDHKIYFNPNHPNNRLKTIAVPNHKGELSPGFTKNALYAAIDGLN